MNIIWNMQRKRAQGDKGMTLVEVLVSIFLLAIVGTIVAATVIQFIKVNRVSNEGVQKEATLNDAVSRITRDIAAAEAVLLTTTASTAASTAGWPANGPDDDELTLQIKRNTNQCVRVRYHIEGNALKAKTSTFPGGVCPTIQTPTSASATTRDVVVVKELNTNSIFTYYDKQNDAITPLPMTTQDEVDDIARIQIDVSASVKDRPNGVRLVTSAAPSSLENLTQGQPNAGIFTALNCPTNFTATRSGNTVALNWDNVTHSDFYEIYRDGTLVGTSNNSTHTDTVPGAGTYAYTLIVKARAGDTRWSDSVPCGPQVVTVPGTPPPPPPPVTTPLACPVTFNVPNNAPPPVLSWSGVPNAASYQVYKNGTLVTTTSATSYTDTAVTPGNNGPINYYLRAMAPAGSTLFTNSPNCATRTWSYTPPAVTPLDCANNLRVTGNTIPTISWDAVPGAANYTVVRNGSAITTTSNTTYTDATAGNTARTYSIVPRAPAGSTTSSDAVGCGSINWSPAPVVGAPNPPVVTTGVNPPTTTPDDWGTQTTSFVRLTWPAVGNAVSYEVWRKPINPTNNADLGGYTRLATTASTFYNDNNVPFGTKYDYYVISVGATANSQPSNTTRALIHPAQPTLNGTVANYNRNELWIAAPIPTASSYTLFRRDAINGGGWSERATFTAANVPTAGSRWTDVVSLSTRYEYRLAVFNNGERGGNTTETYAGLWSNTVNLLQYPDNPVTTATGTENSNSFNPDGRNTANWNTVPTATSYALWEFDNGNNGGVPTIRNTQQANTTRPDFGQPRGTRNFYMAVAYNATGPSPNANNPINKAVAYQRPATPTLRLSAAPNLNSNNVGLTWTREGDAGEATDRFCNSGRLCGSFVLQNGSNEGVTWDTTTNFTYTGRNADWGDTKNWQVNACNLGGCSDPAGERSLHFPGPFQYNNVIARTGESNFGSWAEGAPFTRPENRIASIRLGWTNSAGVRATNSYRWDATERIHDPDNRSAGSWVDTSNTGSAFRVTPGSVINLDVTAYAPNGLSRDMTTHTHQIQPGFVAAQQSTRVCRSSVSNGWKSWSKIHRNSLRLGGGTDGFSYIDGIRITGYVGRLIDPVLTNWNNSLDRVENSGNNMAGAWENPNRWNFRTEYWQNWNIGVSNPFTNNGWWGENAVGGNTSNNQVISNLGGSGGAFKSYAYVNRSGAHAAAAGDWVGFFISDNEYKARTDNSAQNGGCSSQWGPKRGFISRTAERDSRVYGDPNGGGPGWYANP